MAVASALWEADASSGAARLCEADLAARLLMAGGRGFPTGVDPAVAVVDALRMGIPHSLGTVETDSLGESMRLLVRVVPLDAPMVATVWVELPPADNGDGALPRIRAWSESLAFHLRGRLAVANGLLELARLRGATQVEVARISEAVERFGEVTALLDDLAQGGWGSPEPLDLQQLVDEVIPVVRTEIPTSVGLTSQPLARPAPGTVSTSPVVVAPPSSLRRVLHALLHELVPEGGGELAVRVGEIAVTGTERGWVERPPEAGRYGVVELTSVAGGATQPIDPRAFCIPVAASVAVAHGGGLHIGSAVRVLLPLGAALVEPAPVSVPPESLVSVAGTVLVADDDAGVRGAIASALELRGYAVTQVEDGDDAVVEFERHIADGGLDCVVLDLVMKRMSGAEALRRMRELAPGVPILITSGHTPGEVARLLGGHPPDAVLRKPTPLTTMVDQVETAILLRRGRR